MILYKQTSTLFDPVTDHNLYAFDLSLWQLLHRLALGQPELAVRQFQITAETAAHIAQAEETVLPKLASGVLLSFQLDISEQALNLLLEHADDLWEDPALEACNAAYWQLLNRAAKQDAALARLCFGLSEPIVQAIQHATDDQIRHLAQTVMPRFLLRYTEQTLLEYLSSYTEKERDLALLKKMNQSLSSLCAPTF